MGWLKRIGTDKAKGGRDLLFGGCLTAALLLLLNPAARADCEFSKNVRKDGGGDSLTIQGAINMLSTTLSVETCVVIRDTATYSEQVTVRGFTNGGHRLMIMADPTFVSSAPVVNPPVASTAAFQIMNDSVTLQGIDIISTNTVAYGILSSSADVTISSVNVIDPVGVITTAGIAISSRTSVVCSSITETNANASGFVLSGYGNSIFRSTASISGANSYALYLNVSSGNAITQSYFANSLATAAYLAPGANNNTISRSTMTGGGGSPGGIGLSLNGASFNQVTNSVMGGGAGNISGASGGYGLYINVGSSNAITQSVMSGGGGGGAGGSGSGGTASGGGAGNSGSFSCPVSGGFGGYGLYINTSASNTITKSMMLGGGGGAGCNQPGGGYSVYINAGSYNTIAQSTMSAGGGAGGSAGGEGGTVSGGGAGGSGDWWGLGRGSAGNGLYINASSSNTITQSVMFGGGEGAGQSGNGGGCSLYINAGSNNTVTQSVMSAGGGGSAGGGAGGTVSSGGTGNSGGFSGSFSGGSGGYGLYIDASSSNTITQSVMLGGGGAVAAPGGGGGYSLYINAGSSNTITQSVMSAGGAGGGGSGGSGGAGGTVSGSGAGGASGGSSVGGNGGHGAALLSAANFNVISLSTMSGSGGGAGASDGIPGAGAYLAQSANDAIYGSLVQGSTAVYVNGSTGTTIGGSVLVATNTAGSALWLSGGSTNLTLSSSTFSGGTQGAGIYLNAYNSGAINLSSNTISGGKYGLNMATQSAGASLDISSMTFSSLTPGATAINFLGGQFISTFTSVGFNTANISINVNGRLLAANSHITIHDFTGTRAGPSFENDPNNYIEWNDTTAPAAVESFATEAVSSGTIALYWTAPGDDGVGGVLYNSIFTIQYATHTNIAWSTSAAQINIATTGVNPGTNQYYTLGGLSANTSHYFRLWTKDNAGNYSALSNGATVATLANLVSGTQETFLAVFETSATVAWAALPAAPSSMTAEGFILEASSTNFGGGVVYSSFTPNVSLSTLTTTLNRNTTYYFRVGSLNWGGARNYTALGSTATLADQVAGAQVAGVSVSSVTVSWTPLPVSPSSSTCEGYLLQASTASDFSGTILSSSTISPMPSALSVEGLDANTSLYFRVGSLNWGGKANFTAILSTVTTIETPTNIYFDEISTTAIVASAYAPTSAFSNLEKGQSATNVYGNGAWAGWHTGGNTWTTKAPMPTARYGPAGAAVGGKVYVMGGTDQSTYLTTNEEYDPASDTWVTKAAMPTGRWALAAAVMGGKVYAVGGYGGGPKTANEEYDPASDTWITKATMPTARSGLAAAVVSGKLYALGGNYLATNEEYDPASNIWITKPAMPTGRRYLAAAVVGGKVYAIGGGPPAGGYLNQNEEYDSASDAWATKAAMPTARDLLAAAAVGGKVYAVGGEGYKLMNEVYDPALDIWTTRTSMLAERDGPAIAVASGKIYVVGGWYNSATNEEFDPGVAAKFAGLLPNKFYSFKAKAKNQNGIETAESITVSTYTLAAVALPLPETPLFSSISTSTVLVNWSSGTLSGGFNGPGATYLVEASTNPEFYSAATLSSQTFNLNSTLSGLPANTTHYFRIKAANSAGVWGNYLTLGSTSTLAAMPSPPIGTSTFTAVWTSSMTVSWSSGSATEGYNPGGTRYQIDISTMDSFDPLWTSSATLNLSATFYALSENSTFYARARAFNNNGVPSGYWNLSSTATLAKVPAPLGNTFLAVYETSATVAWAAMPTAPSSMTAEGFVLEASSTNFGGGVVYSTFTPNVSLSTLTAGFSAALDRNTTYYFRVGSLNWGGTPNYTVLGSTVTRAKAPVQLGNTFLAVFETSATVAWAALPASPPSMTAEGFILEASSTNFGGGVVYSSFTANVLVSTLTAGFGAALDRNTTYYFRVGSLNWGGAPNYTVLGSTSTRAKAPVQLSNPFLSVSETSATVAWAALPAAPSSMTAEGFVLEASSSNFSGGVVYSSSTPNVSLSTLTTTLDCNTTYFFRVGSLNWGGAPNYTALGSTVTLAGPLFGVQIASVFPTSGTVNWVPLPTAEQAGSSSTSEGYMVQASTAANFSGVLFSSMTQSVTFSTLTVSGLSVNSTYYFRAGSLNWAGRPNFAVAGSTITLAAMPSPPIGTSTFTAVWTSSMTVSWSSGNVTEGYNPSGTRYQVDISTMNSFDPLWASSATLNLSATFYALLENSTFYAHARAFNNSGVPSAYWNLGSTSTLAKVPVQLGNSFLAVFETSATVAWAALPAAPSSMTAEGFVLEASSINFSGGVVYSSFTPNVSLSTLTAGFGAALDRNTTYYFRVGSRNWGGAPNYTILGSTVTLAKPISGVQIVSVFPTSGTVNWVPLPTEAQAGSSSTSEGYLVQASTAADFSGVIFSSMTPNVGLSTLTVSGLSGGTAYYFRVGSLNWTGVPNFITTTSTTTAATYLSGTISVDTTWNLANSPYVVTGDIVVASGKTLTIAAGVVVKFQPNASMGVRGVLNAAGTQTNPIVFTSIKDDTYGGDTNRDNGNTTPDRGDWNRVLFLNNGTASTLDHVIVAYGGANPANRTYQDPSWDYQGQGYFTYSGMISIGAYAPPGNYVDIKTTITNSTITLSSTEGLWVYRSSPSLGGDAFSRNNTAGLLLFGDSFPDYPAANTSSLNGFNGIDVAGNIAGSGWWRPGGAPYVVTADVIVDAGYTLNITTGVVVKFSSGTSLAVRGVLSAIGTGADPIVFTSLRDDYSGDTNGDYDVTHPAMGDWNRILFLNSSVASTLNNVMVRYGGGGALNGSYDVPWDDCSGAVRSVYSGMLTVGYDSGCSPGFTNTQLSLTTSTIVESATEAIWIFDSHPTIGPDLMVYNNSSYDISANSVSGSSVNAQHNWWGNSSPNPSQFYGRVDYEPYLIYAPPVPHYPTEFLGTAISTSAIRWNWKDNATNETEYRIYTGADQLRVSLDPDTTYWIETTGLSANLPYTRYVGAYNSDGMSRSDSRTVYSLANIPSALSISQETSTSVELSWTGDGTRYKIERAPDIAGSSGTFNPIVSWSDILTTTTYRDGSLPSYTTYWYRVSAYNGDQVLRQSSTSIAGQTTPAAVSTPTDSGAFSTNPSLTFNWGAVTEADKYHVQIGSSPGGNSIFDNELAVLTTSVTGIESHTYYCRVRAKSSDGRYGDWSSSSDGIGIDSTPPGVSTITSPTHPLTTVYYMLDNPSFDLSSADNFSGVAGHYYVLDSTANPPPTELSNYTEQPSLVFSDVPDGSYFLYARPKDGAGNLGATNYFRINILTSLDPGTAQSYTLSDGSVIAVPAGAVDTAVSITATPRATLPSSPAGSRLIRPSSKAIDISLGTPGVVLQKPITITMLYQDAEVADLDESKLKLAYWDEAKRIWTLLGQSTPYPLENKVVGTIEHLSLFGIVQFGGSGSGSSDFLVEAYNYPNPFKPGSGTTIRYILSRAGREATIRIYDIQGRVVRELPGTADANINDVFWDGKNLGGGKVGTEVFVCRIEVVADDGSKTKKYIKPASWK